MADDGLHGPPLARSNTVGRMCDELIQKNDFFAIRRALDTEDNLVLGPIADDAEDITQIQSCMLKKLLLSLLALAKKNRDAQRKASKDNVVVIKNKSENYLVSENPNLFFSWSKARRKTFL